MNKKVSLIVGGAKSLGKFICENLIKENHFVILIDIDKQESQKWINNYSKKEIIFFEGNACSEKDIEKIFNKIEDLNLKIDNLIYNAGWIKTQKVTEIDFDNIMQSLNVNLIGYILFCKYTSKHMIKNNIKGSFININSKSGKTGSKYNACYSGAKFGAIGITQSVALDLADYKIRVNSLMLGNLLESQMFRGSIPQYAKKLKIKDEEVINHYKNKVPLKRGCQFQDVFNVLMFYISDKANYITGQSINITGGQIMF